MNSTKIAMKSRKRSWLKSACYISIVLLTLFHLIQLKIKKVLTDAQQISVTRDLINCLNGCGKECKVLMEEEVQPFYCGEFCTEKCGWKT